MPRQFLACAEEPQWLPIQQENPQVQQLHPHLNNKQQLPSNKLHTPNSRQRRSKLLPGFLPVP
jgi:hypothetical protein